MSRLIRNIRYSLVEQVVLSTHIFVSVALIRYLGPEQYGVYSYYLSVAGIVSVLGLGGFESLYVREASRQRSDEALTATLVLLNFLGSALATAVLFGYYLFYAESDRLSPLLMAFTACGTYVTIKNTFRASFIAHQELRLAALLNMALFALNVVLKVAGILTAQPLVYFFALIAVDAVASVLAFGTAYGWRRALALDGFFRRTAHLFVSGWPLLLAGLSILIFMKVDQVMLFHMRSERELGAYASMMWLTERLFIFIGVVMTAFFPYLSEKYASDRDQYFRAVRVGQKLFSIIVVPMVVFLVANDAQVVRAVFGEGYVIDSQALQFLAGALLFIYWGAINQKVLIVTNALRLDLFFAGSSALVSLALNFVLIPRYGIVGAAVAAFVSHGFYFWAQFFIREYRRYNLYILLSVPAPLVLALASLALSRLAGSNVVVQFAVYAGAYGLLVLALLRAPLSEEYGTIGRLFFSKMMRFGRGTA